MDKQYWRKRPLDVEAYKLTTDNLIELEAWCDGLIKGIHLPKRFRVIEIMTLEGSISAKIGDWIIKDIKGEFYPCKPDIFELSYEKVE